MDHLHKFLHRTGSKTVPPVIPFAYKQENRNWGHEATVGRGSLSHCRNQMPTWQTGARESESTFEAAASHSPSGEIEEQGLCTVLSSVEDMGNCCDQLFMVHPTETHRRSHFVTGGNANLRLT